jgi:hypothetical protein
MVAVLDRLDDLLGFAVGDAMETVSANCPPPRLAYNLYNDECHGLS